MLPTATTDIQPVFVFAAIFVDYAKLHEITEKFLFLKQRFYPAAFPKRADRFLGGILTEIKGSDLRNRVASGNRNQRRHALGFLDGVTKIVSDTSIALTGRVWVKAVGAPINGRSLYTFSIQSIYAVFQKYLEHHDDFGAVVLDSRWQHQNSEVAHSIFTQKFQMAGDAFDRIIDLPAFAHSNNHAGLQIADVLASGLLFPMSTLTYCTGHITGVHVHVKHQIIKDRYRSALRQIQYQYQEASGQRRGGIIVSDPLGQRHSGLLFR
jgi:hypothetical protein